MISSDSEELELDEELSPSFFVSIDKKTALPLYLSFRALKAEDNLFIH